MLLLKDECDEHGDTYGDDDNDEGDDENGTVDGINIAHPHSYCLLKAAMFAESSNVC